MTIRVFYILFAFISVNAALFGQAPSATDIHGQIVYPSGTVPSDFSVELHELRGAQRTVDKTTVLEDGRFVFDRVPPSVYLARVTSPSGGVVGEQIVDPLTNLTRVRVRLPDKGERLPKSALVSLAELAHKVPDKARKETREADKALKKKDLASMIAHLEKVVKIDPAFIAARKNLALAYLKMLQYGKAIESFQILAALDVHSPLPYYGLSVSYYDLNLLADSEAAARRVLEMDGSSELGHFLLGTTLAAQDKDRSQALRHLASALNHFPVAHVTAAAILARQGFVEEAKIHLRAYLDSGEKALRTEAEDLLSRLY